MQTQMFVTLIEDSFKKMQNHEAIEDLMETQIVEEDEKG